MPAASPRVSIVIPVYNGADYLREAVESALAQTYPDVEVIVVNDGSRDGGATEAIARSFGDRIRYLSKENGGVSSALNAGIAAMTGEYFSWLSHDDLYLPDKVATQVAALEPGGLPCVLYGDYEFIGPSGEPLGPKHVTTRGQPMRVALLAGDPVNGCTVLVPRACFDAVGTFDTSLRTVQDYDLWFRMAKRFPFVHLAGIHVRSRLHPGQGTLTIPGRFDEVCRCMIRLLEQLGPEDIQASRARSASAFYSALALNFKLRGFDAVAQAALALSARNAAGEGLTDATQRAAVRLACAVLTRKMKPAYWTERIRALARGR